MVENIDWFRRYLDFKVSRKSIIGMFPGQTCRDMKTYINPLNTTTFQMAENIMQNIFLLSHHIKFTLTGLPTRLNKTIESNTICL